MRPDKPYLFARQGVWIPPPPPSPPPVTLTSLLPGRCVSRSRTVRPQSGGWGLGVEGGYRPAPLTTRLSAVAQIKLDRAIATLFDVTRTLSLAFFTFIAPTPT